MSSLYVSRTFEEADNWGKYLVKIDRLTYSIVKLEIDGNCFYGNATKCFNAQLDAQENMRLADIYWKNENNDEGDPPIVEMLIDGHIS